MREALFSLFPQLIRVIVRKLKPIFFINRFRVNQFLHDSVHRRFVIFFNDFSKEGSAVHGPDLNLLVGSDRSGRLSSSQLSLEKDEFELNVVEHRSTEQSFEEENFSRFLRSDERESVRCRVGESAQQSSEVVVGTESARFRVDEINLRKKNRKKSFGCSYCQMMESYYLCRVEEIN